MRKDHKLYAWYKKDDIHGDISPRFDNSALHFVFDKIFTKETLKELADRGFDLNTLKFSIERSPQAINKHEVVAGRTPYDLDLYIADVKKKFYESYSDQFQEVAGEAVLIHEAKKGTLDFDKWAYVIYFFNPQTDVQRGVYLDYWKDELVLYGKH